MADKKRIGNRGRTSGARKLQMAGALWLFEPLGKAAWERFKCIVWPVIRDEILQKVLEDIFRELRQRIEVWFAGQKREANARNRADIESSRADAAADPVEAEKHRRLAQELRQRAEKYRQENESLKREVARLLTEGADLGERLDRDIDLHDEGGRPMIGQRTLPLLDPSPSTYTLNCPHCGAELTT